MSERSPVYATAATPEGAKAQAKIIKGLFTGRGLQPAYEQNELDEHYRNFVRDRSRRARVELQSLMGLSFPNVTEENEGNAIPLDAADKDRAVEYLLNAFGWAGMRGRVETAGETRVAAELDRRMDRFREESSVELFGPILQVNLRTKAAYQLFREGRDIGNSTFMPLPPDESGGNQGVSRNIHVNFVVEGEVATEGQDTQKHEFWHAIDAFRKEEYNQLKNPQDSTSLRAFEQSADDSGSNIFKERLENYFFDPNNFVASLASLRTAIPEVFDVYVPFDLDESPASQLAAGKLFEQGFLSIQLELPAYIAGYFDGDTVDVISDQRKDTLANNFNNMLTPFQHMYLGALRKKAKLDKAGVWVVNTDMVDKEFNPDNPILRRSNQPWQRMLNRYSKGDWQHRTDINKTGYIQDLQQMVNFFLNPGGPGYEAEARMKDRIGQSIDAFRTLATFRDDPYQALVELSLLPVSHWEMYTQRQLQP